MASDLSPWSLARVYKGQKKFDTPFFFVARFRGNDNNRLQRPSMVSSLLIRSPIDGFSSSGMIQMFWLCSLFGRVFIDFNYTFALRLKVGRLPTREEEAARSPVYPDHLFVFFQTQFQMLQEVVPNNWIGIPGNTSDPDTSKAYSKKLLAPYDALVY